MSQQYKAPHLPISDISASQQASPKVQLHLQSWNPVSFAQMKTAPKQGGSFAHSSCHLSFHFENECGNFQATLLLNSGLNKSLSRDDSLEEITWKKDVPALFKTNQQPLLSFFSCYQQWLFMSLCKRNFQSLLCSHTPQPRNKKKGKSPIMLPTYNWNILAF